MSKNKPTHTSFFVHERGIKLIILLISFVFWLFVKLSKEYRTSTTLRVKWVIPDSLALRSAPPDALHVTYQGEGWSLLRSYAKTSIEVAPKHLNAGNFPFGRRELLPYLENRFSKGIEILDFSPDNFILEVDRRLQKRLPVKLRVEPQFKPGYTQKGEILVRPDSVDIAGPEEEVRQLSFVETELWQPKELSATISNPTLRLNDHNHSLSIRPNTVQATISVEQLTEKSFFVPIALLNTKDSIRFFPTKVKITFSVALSQFDQVQPSDFELAADFAEIQPGSNTNTLPIQIKKQASTISNLRFKPNSIEFFIEKE